MRTEDRYMNSLSTSFIGSRNNNESSMCDNDQ